MYILTIQYLKDKVSGKLFATITCRSCDYTGTTSIMKTLVEGTWTHILDTPLRRSITLVDQDVDKELKRCREVIAKCRERSGVSVLKAFTVNI